MENHLIQGDFKMFDTLYNTIDILLPFQWLSHTFMKNAFIAILIITPLFFKNQGF